MMLLEKIQCLEGDKEACEANNQKTIKIINIKDSLVKINGGTSFIFYHQKYNLPL